MFTRFRAALRTLVSGSTNPPELTPTCARCAELKREVAYWREREERTADALLSSKGIGTRVASPAPPPPMNQLASLAKGMGITEIDTKKSKQPGQGAMTSGSDRAN